MRTPVPIGCALLHGNNPLSALRASWSPSRAHTTRNRQSPTSCPMKAQIWCHDQGVVCVMHHVVTGRSTWSPTGKSHLLPCNEFRRRASVGRWGENSRRPLYSCKFSNFHSLRAFTASMNISGSCHQGFPYNARSVLSDRAN